MMRRAWMLPVVAGALAVAAQSAIRVRTELQQRSRAEASHAVQAETERRAADIAFFEARAARDPQGAMDRAQLGALYLQRAREGNDFQDYLRADSVARLSLSLRASRNASALAVLASALLAQHRFTEAQATAQRLAEAEPTTYAYRAMLGETCIETGDYECARSAFESVPVAARTSLSVAPRIARWAELRGDTAGARVIFRTIMKTVSNAPDMPREQQAWFYLRAADLEMRQGRLRTAGGMLQQGLMVSPGDHRLLSAASRLALAQHQWERAIQSGDSAIAIALDPATLGVISDAYAARGDSARATEYFSAMEAAVGQQPGAFHRAWSLFLLDHGRHTSEVLAAAQAEIANRRDINGYDLLAWALFKSGRFTEAREAMSHALALGTQDALLFYHAGMIERAAGNTESARAFLQRALAISPSFDAFAASNAREVLHSMARTFAAAPR